MGPDPRTLIERLLEDGNPNEGSRTRLERSIHQNLEDVLRWRTGSVPYDLWELWGDGAEPLLDVLVGERHNASTLGDPHVRGARLGRIVKALLKAGEPRLLVLNVGVRGDEREVMLLRIEIRGTLRDGSPLHVVATIDTASKQVRAAG